MEYFKEGKRNIYVAAHRGWCSKYPENTMIAFQKALELGVDQIETDVRVSADGELVLIHDATVDRTTDGEGLVCEPSDRGSTPLSSSQQGAAFIGGSFSLQEFVVSPANISGILSPTHTGRTFYAARSFDCPRRWRRYFNRCSDRIFI